MIPGNVDPRRPEKVQRYKAPQANGNPAVEDLTPDYMNILGPDSATANADATESVKSGEHQQTEDPSTSIQDSTIQTTSNGTNVIPTSPQYGVAIMTNDVPSETSTSSTDTVVDSTAKSDGDNKDMHSTPSRNDRFKVVKIASLEPFRRGRWKCMDYVDENPPQTTPQSKSSQSSTNLQMGGNIYMQTQSLPQQHFQQMLVQGGFTTPQQFYQNLPSQMMQQSQYFYPAQNVGNMQQVPVNAIQASLINANQQYFPANVVPHSAGFTNYTNVQYVPSNLIQNQGSAFVSTTQNVNAQLPPNFQQSQTYAGPPSGTLPMVNGHAYPQPTEPQVVASSLPTQVAKNVILSANVQPNSISQTIPQIVPSTPLTQSQVVQNASYTQVPNTGYQQGSVQNQTNSTQNVSLVPSGATATPVIPVISAQSINHVPTSTHQIPVSGNPILTTGTLPTQAAITVNLSHLPNAVQHIYDPNLPTNVYTNPQFVASVNSIPVMDSGSGEGQPGGSEMNADNDNASGEDAPKTAPPANAIDNKIEQAMDLVKSHLMYTVREEVEVLKEKIAELMERIQQLESENTFLKQQIPKLPNNNNPNGTPDPPQ